MKTYIALVAIVLGTAAFALVFGFLRGLFRFLNVVTDDLLFNLDHALFP